MARKIICAAVFAVMLAGLGLYPTIPAAMAGHVKMPSFAGAKASQRGEALEPCSIMGFNHRIEFVTLLFPDGSWARLYFKGKDRNPYGLFDARGDGMVYWDADRDGHFDGRVRPGEQPAGDNWCDLLQKILEGKARPVRP